MPEKLAGIIKKHRKELGWSQQRLAEETGLSHGIIQTLEVARVKSPGKIILVKLADAFGISLDELIGRKVLPRRRTKS